MSGRARAVARGHGAFVWLASYPKSGSTWFRALLTSYLNGGAPPAINNLVGRSLVVDRESFNQHLGVDSSELPEEELLRLRPAFHRLLAAAAGADPRPVFQKVHEAFLRLPPGRIEQQRSGDWLYAGEVTAAAICLVRNPLDVAVSYADHRNITLAEAIAWMDNPTATEGHLVRGLNTVLPELLGRWSDHVLGWLDQREFPMRVVRYEDLAADPVPALDAALAFLERHCPALADRPARPEAIAKAVANAAFDRLRAQEAKEGFRERQPTARSSFFRAGVAGGWRDALTARQVAEVVAAHGPAMGRLGYLAEAEGFLRDAGR